MKITSTVDIMLDEKDVRAAIVAHVQMHGGTSIDPKSIKFLASKTDVSVVIKTEAVSEPIAVPAAVKPPAPITPSNSKLAFEAGRFAKQDGEPITSNPYPEASTEGQDWLKGWTSDVNETTKG